MNEQAKTRAEKPKVGQPSKAPPSKTEGGAPSVGEGITIRKCSALQEFHACVELQREIWEEEDLELEPSTMFVVASITGGQALGAFEGGKLVGFTMAVVGVRNGVAYLHSHQTGVSAAYRDRGVGRMLKLFQRDDALARGIRLVEWTFDPLEMKNAHFNLNRLGAICRRYLPNLYGVTTSPLHRGIDTDRLVAEWQLDSPRVIAAIQDLAPTASHAPATIDVPAEVELLKQDEKKTREVQGRVREEFTELFARGYAAIGVRRESKGSAYLLAPWSDF
jgi:predicted GNAT superfamily acetyltransferase